MNVDFEPSKLGTKEYWDEFYQEELNNYMDNNNDHGEVWFGISSAAKMVNWIITFINDPSQQPLLRFIEIGCGNGHLLNSLYDKGFRNLIGIDYSEHAIDLAQSIASQLQQDIEFKALDLFNNSKTYHQLFDFVLDKGTFDAISLSKGNKESIRSYRDAVAGLLSTNGVFLLTSCNWTQEELLDLFGASFDCIDRIQHPVFSFGGVQGQAITTLAFRLKAI